MKKSDLLQLLHQGWQKATQIIRKLLLHNLGLKLLSLVCALVFWSYVVLSSPNITREKTIESMGITVTGQAVLENRGLAVLTSLNSLENAQVRVRAPQSNYAQVTGENVRVELDLSGIRQEGRQVMRLRGISTYGNVVEVTPQYVELDVEKRDQRYVPVNVELAGSMDETAYWYNVSSKNPSQVLVSGPASRVKTISEALVNLDVGDRTGSHSREAQFILLDDQGNEVEGAVGLSTSSVRVAVDVYPLKTLALRDNKNEVLRGHTAQGYQVESIQISPDTVVAAAEQTLLDSMESLSLETINITGAAQSFDTVTRVRSLSGIKYLSSQDVTVTVNIAEQNLSRAFGSVAIESRGLDEGLEAQPSTRRVNVKAEGPYSQASALAREDVQAVVNLDGLLPGQYVLPVEVSAPDYPQLQLTVTPATVAVTITQAGAQGADQ